MTESRGCIRWHADEVRAKLRKETVDSDETATVDIELFS